eukprot:scaffold22522_cov84-Skeletonema_dohrnii-CCMP3373.AAC.1
MYSLLWVEISQARIHRESGGCLRLINDYHETKTRVLELRQLYVVGGRGAWAMNLEDILQIVLEDILQSKYLEESKSDL